MRRKFYSIDTMYKRILELLILSALFVLPLSHVSLEDSSATRTMWSWLIVITSILIIFFATYPFRVQKFFPIILALVSTITASSFLLGIYPPQGLGIYIVVLAVLISIGLHPISSRNKNIFAALLLCCMALYAQWGIAQFIVQHDLGLRRIGESVLTTSIPGIASFYLDSEKFIRAYGPFGHSNSFAGVLLLGILLVYRYEGKLKSPLFLSSITFVISLGIIVSFSRTALAGLALIAILSLYKRRWSLITPVAINALLFIPLFLTRSLDTHGAAVHERLVGLRWLAHMTTIPTLVRGFGIGNYTTALTEYVQNNSIAHNSWDIAPIHSAPLLLIAELGLIVCIPLFLVLIRFVFIKKAWILAALLPALIFDHYFVTQISPLIFLITTARLVVQ